MALFDLSVRCKKCRENLFAVDEYPLTDCHKKLLSIKNDINVTNSDEGFHNTNEEIICETQRDNSMIFLNGESYPLFIENAVNEALWQKGKLYCPKCNRRIGSFNFVNALRCSCQSSLLPAVHLHNSKVDYILPNKQINPALSMPHSSTASTSGEDYSATSNDSVLNLDATHINCSFDKDVPDEEKVALVKQTAKASVKSDLERQKLSEANEVEMKSDEEFAADLPDNLICAVCLDLLYSPFIVKPCNHIYCEPCLRRLAKPSPTNTSCPLCRELIGLCNPCHEMSREIKDNFPEHYNERHKFEQLHESRHLPLPWLRDYRFLGFRERLRQGNYGRNWTGWRTILWIFILDCLGLSLVLAIKWVLGDYEANLQQIEIQSKQRTLDTPGSLELESSYPDPPDLLWVKGTYPDPDDILGIFISNDSIFETILL